MTEFTDQEVEEWIEDVCDRHFIGYQTGEEFFEWCVLKGKLQTEYDCSTDQDFKAFTRETVINRLTKVFGAFSERYVEYVEDHNGEWEDPECDEEADLQWKDEFIAQSSEYRRYINYGVDYDRQMQLFPEFFEKDLTN